MNARVWINRAAAAACVLLLGLAFASAVAIGGDVAAVNAARRTDAPPPATGSSMTAPAALKPLLRANAATPNVAVGEFINLRLGDLGLFVSAVDVASVRPFGNGLKLAEVRVTAAGSLSDIASVANWVAINREAVRLKSMTVEQGADGRGGCTLVLLMVVA